jgi:hypothetical protein
MKDGGNHVEQDRGHHQSEACSCFYTKPSTFSGGPGEVLPGIFVVHTEHVAVVL